MIKIIDNCCSPYYLDCLKGIASSSDNWHFQYPPIAPIEDRFPKLEIFNNGLRQPLLAGLAMGLLIQIYEASGRSLFILDPIAFCGISIKDRLQKDIIHTDYEKDIGMIKIFGIINSDWKEEWGGEFFHDGTSNYIKPTSFCVFDGSEPHAAAAILTDKKRFAIDFAVFRDQQSLNRVRGIGNK